MQRMNDLDPTLLRFAERAVAQIPVPARPSERRGRRSLVTDVAVVVAAVALLLGGTFAGRLLNDARSGAATQPSSTPDPAEGNVGGPLVAPPPNLVQNPRFGYNLTLPFWFRKSPDAEGAFAQHPGLQRAGLLSVEVYTSRTSEQEQDAATAGRQFRPWDLYIEVWERQGRSAEEWARSWYGCASECTLTDTVLRGAPGVIATFGGSTRGKAYLLERGDQLLVLGYTIGSENDLRGTSEAMLEQIITSIGLLPPQP
jgi:hypothetical protein